MELWEFVGVVIFAGPLILTIIGLAIVMIRTGIEELLQKPSKPAYELDIDLTKYIQDVKTLMASLKRD